MGRVAGKKAFFPHLRLVGLGFRLRHFWRAAGVGTAPGPGNVGSHRGFWTPGTINPSLLFVF